MSQNSKRALKKVESRRVDGFADLLPDWQADLSQQEKFVAEARRILGGCETGRILDEFGGRLFYAYCPPPADNQHNIKRLIDRHFEGHKAEVSSKIPAAQKSYVSHVSEKLSEALRDAVLESLHTVFQAIGKSYKAWRTDLWRRKSCAVQETLEDGFVVRRRVKKDPGLGLTDEEWSRERLEAALADLENLFLSRPSQVTLSTIARKINTLWAPGENFSASSLQKLLERRGIDWRRRKKEMIERIKIRQEETNSPSMSDKLS
ncbi:MAG TPA: hypothetical protein VF297_03370 [Pyrinomonadaceae bacterium]